MNIKNENVTYDITLTVFKNGIGINSAGVSGETLIEVVSKLTLVLIQFAKTEHEKELKHGIDDDIPF